MRFPKTFNKIIFFLVIKILELIEEYDYIFKSNFNSHIYDRLVQDGDRGYWW
jgi:hypothetical protein